LLAAWRRLIGLASAGPILPRPADAGFTTGTLLNSHSIDIVQPAVLGVALSEPEEPAPMPPALVGLAEIASLANVTQQTVVNWRLRFDEFPRPLEHQADGPVWDRAVITAWLKDFVIEPTHILSFINLKGGVGKTTTAVAVAEMLAHEQRKHTLLIDLDPQTNATVTLIPEMQWAELDQAGRTIAQLFEDRLNPHSPPRFDIEKAITKRVSTVNDGIARLDLLASSIQLVDLQDRLPLIALTANYTANPQDILRTALLPVIDRYDYIIIDCPPSLGTVTKNGLRISTGYVIPTIPDIVSTWGIYQIVDNVARFAQDIDRPIPALGIVATKVQGNNLHGRVIEDLRAGRLGRFGEPGGRPQPAFFQNTIPQSVSVARGADVDADIRTLRGKYGEAYGPLHGLTQEIQALCQKIKP
jgi:chromosome partitioning protein